MTSKDGTLRIERLDANAECDGLVPTSAPDAIVVAATPPSLGGCGGSGSVSDGTGHVAAHIGSAQSGQTWQAFTPAGAPREQFRSTQVRIFPQPEGWIAVSAGRQRNGWVHAEAYHADGSLRGTVRIERDSEMSPITQWIAAEDPRAGVLVMHTWFDLDGTRRCGGDARRIGPDGVVRGAPVEIACRFVSGGVSSRGEALVLEDRGDLGGELWVRWIRPDGRAAAAPAREGATEALFPNRFLERRLVPLLDGSLVVNDNEGAWTRRYPHLATRGETAPGWLVGRAGWSFRNTRGNRGYAFFPPRAVAQSADCSQTVELVAPSGLLCGKVTLLNPGGPCWLPTADQGWDGTIVETNPRETCSFRWWPRALAAD